jgi:FixJ family two-component response regulator
MAKEALWIKSLRPTIKGVSHIFMQSPTVFVVHAPSAQLDALSCFLGQAELNVEAFDSADALLEQCDPARPGCVLLDVSPPGINWPELNGRLLQRQVINPVIILASECNPRAAMEALKSGALDFFESPFDHDSLLQAVRNAIALDATNRRALRIRAEVAQRFDRLTRRERQVMDSMLEGKSSKEISIQLNMSVRTVEYHRAKVMQKIGTSTLVELVRMAILAFGCHCMHKHNHLAEIGILSPPFPLFSGVACAA